MFCENCGQSVPDSAAVCKFCGQTFNGAAETSESPQSKSFPGSMAARKLEEADALLVFPASRIVLGALERGSVIRRIVALVLRLVGILIVLGGVYGLVDILKLSFHLSTQGTLGGLVFAVIFVAGIVAMLQICFYRAGNVDRLGESPYPVMAVFSVGFRTIGELYAVLLATVGLGGCLFLWFSGFDPMTLLSMLGNFLPFVPSGSGTFLDGAKFLITMLLLAFGFLLFFYFLAEAVLSIADIAKNVRLLAKADDQAS